MSGLWTSVGQMGQDRGKLSQLCPPLTGRPCVRVNQSDALQQAPLLHPRNDVHPKANRPRIAFSSTVESALSTPPADCWKRKLHADRCSPFLHHQPATEPATRARAAYSGSPQPSPSSDRRVRPISPPVYFPFLSLAQLSFLSFLSFPRGFFPFFARLGVVPWFPH